MIDTVKSKIMLNIYIYINIYICMYVYVCMYVYIYIYNTKVDLRDLY